jgi:hypothetical protein
MPPGRFETANPLQGANRLGPILREARLDAALRQRHDADLIIRPQLADEVDGRIGRRPQIGCAQAPVVDDDDEAPAEDGARAGVGQNRFRCGCSSHRADELQRVNRPLDAVDLERQMLFAQSLDGRAVFPNSEKIDADELNAAAKNLPALSEAEGEREKEKQKLQNTPFASMASATLAKPARLAPFT